jgi:hypothetical protein
MRFQRPPNPSKQGPESALPSRHRHCHRRWWPRPAAKRRWAGGLGAPRRAPFAWRETPSGGVGGDAGGSVALAGMRWGGRENGGARCLLLGAGACSLRWMGVRPGAGQWALAGLIFLASGSTRSPWPRSRAAGREAVEVTPSRAAVESAGRQGWSHFCDRRGGGGLDLCHPGPTCGD